MSLYSNKPRFSQHEDSGLGKLDCCTDPGSEFHEDPDRVKKLWLSLETHKCLRVAYRCLPGVCSQSDGCVTGSGGPVLAQAFCSDGSIQDIVVGRRLVYGSPRSSRALKQQNNNQHRLSLILQGRGEEFGGKIYGG